MNRYALLALPILCTVLLAPGPAAAQESGYYVRVAPAFSRTSVEHVKEVFIGQALSGTSSSATAPELSMSLAGGFRGQPARGWFVGLEVEGMIFAPRVIEADLDPTAGNAPDDIGAGMWEYSNKGGMGANVVLERALGARPQRLLFFAGVHRMRTEVASGGTHRGTGQFEEDREIRSRWPFTGGGGVAWGPMHLRVSYFSSLINWSFLSPEIEVHYSWRASGVAVSLGAEVF
ncbi:MAG: hypothetical protein F4123_12410 [Gemmatimonadetes bacterium]|nr:hypothetical protein [Gemmatimonadota bacterium]MYC00087.1 hypothetical protein [Gemmatimonadota bacterium]MYI47157.1 hypothetical protein [Gemmatimonadota bacterium]